jgi:serine/threonine-protein kinase
VWVFDIERGTLVRLTFDAGADVFPVWNPDGASIIFSSDRDGAAMNLYRKPADGSGQAERLSTSESDQYPYSVSADGKTLLLSMRNDETVWDIMMLNLEEGGEAEAFLQTPFFEGSATFSADGKWVAYGSNESGKWEIYVRPFPVTGGKWQISTGGGGSARWSPDGKELYYRDDDKLMAVAVTAEGGSFSADRPRILFEASSGGPGALIPYDVAPDGKRFVWLKDHMPEQSERTHLRFVFNWFDDIRAKVPTGTR